MVPRQVTGEDFESTLLPPETTVFNLWLVSPSLPWLFLKGTRKHHLARGLLLDTSSQLGNLGDNEPTRFLMFN